MSSAGRAPWWYSGDDEQPQADDVPEANGTPETDGVPETDGAPDDDGTSSAMDWTALVAGAAKMVDWATERVMAPHAEHTDPAEHPDCMVCRTVALIGDPVGLMSGQRPPPDGADAQEDVEVPSPGASRATGATSIRWIPIVESRD